MLAKEKLAVILTDGDWNGKDYRYLNQIAKQNPDMRLYVIALEMSEYEIDRLRNVLTGVEVLVADDADGIVTQYIEIAKKHLV